MITELGWLRPPKLNRCFARNAACAAENCEARRVRN